MSNQKPVSEMTNRELSDHLKKVVWTGGWDATLKEVERRLKKLTRLEKKDTKGWQNYIMEPIGKKKYHVF